MNPGGPMPPGAFVDEAVVRLAALGARAKPLVERLPMQPPAWALARALDRWLLPRLAPDVRDALRARAVEIVVTDLGLALRLQLATGGFRVAPPDAPTQLRIAAASTTLWRLLRGADDADRLFFERALVSEGDTELGLVIKNTLDAIGPLWG